MLTSVRGGMQALYSLLVAELEQAVRAERPVTLLRADRLEIYVICLYC